MPKEKKCKECGVYLARKWGQEPPIYVCLNPLCDKKGEEVKDE